VDVSADAYPYTAYSTSLNIYLKPWAKEGGAEAIAARLRKSDTRARIRGEVEEQIVNDPGSYERVIIIGAKNEKNKPVIGMNLVEIGELWNMEPVDAMLQLIEEEETNVPFVGHGMSPENVEMVLSQPWVMIGSDGYSLAPRDKALETRHHPRSYGTYPRVLGYYARERKIFDLPLAVKKMTSMPADRMGFTDRGRIAMGMKADLVVFDQATVRDKATFDDPHQYPVGIKYVLVNGELAAEDGKHTGARPGRVLRKA
ncbi:MAG: amidohydrolase family protein, partial [Gemmatimonadota bacterium]|nr:amidohydrolase family protein [Gemmatimonadota bacterium]